MRTTTIGSYPRVTGHPQGEDFPGSLTRWERGTLSDQQLEEVYRKATQRILHEQEACGVDVVTDGQVRWDDLVSPLAKKIQGFQVNGLARFFDNNIYYRRPILIAAPAWEHPITVNDFIQARSMTTRPLKAVLVGPLTFALLSEDRYYRDVSKFVLALAEILRKEAQALQKAGCRHLQVDEPALAVHPQFAPLAIEALNHIFSTLRMTRWLCLYFGDVTKIVRKLMKVECDVLGLDVVTSPQVMNALKGVAVTKALAIGCVDARNTRLETPEALTAILKRCLRLAPADDLYASPNCGLEFLPHEFAVKKLKRLVDVAKRLERKRA